MTNLLSIFRAGFVRRWHANPDLCHTVDRIDGHSARVARTIVKLWPDSSRNIILAALTHDDGESVTGDIPWTYTKTPEQLQAEKEARDKLWPDLRRNLLTGLEQRRLKFADRLDAYLWARHHAPHILGDSDWRDARNWLLDEADALGVKVDL